MATPDKSSAVTGEEESKSSTKEEMKSGSELTAETEGVDASHAPALKAGMTEKNKKQKSGEGASATPIKTSTQGSMI